GPRVAHAALKAFLGMPSGSKRIELSDLSIDGQWFGAPEPGAAQKSATGKPTAFSVTSSKLNLDTGTETLEPTELEVKWGKLPIELSAAGEKLFTHRIVKGKLSIAPLSPRELMPSLGVTPPVTRDSKVLSRFSVTSGYRLT